MGLPSLTRVSHGSPMGLPLVDVQWVFRGSLMIYLWVSHGSPLSPLWACHEFSGVPWMSHGSAHGSLMGLPVVSDGSFMRHPCVCHGYQLGVPLRAV